MPPLHPMIVHFPIALFLVAVLLDFISAIRLRSIARRDSEGRRNIIRSFDPATRVLMVLGFIGAVVAVASGEWLKVQRQAVLPKTLLGWHQGLAIAFVVWYALMLIARLRRSFLPKAAYLTMAAFGAVLLTAVGHTGGTMAWPATEKVAIPVKQSAPQPSQSTTTKSKQQTTQSKPTQPTKRSPNRSPKQTAKTTKPKQPTINQVQYQTGYHAFVSYCQSCHGLDMSTNRFGRYSASQWQTVVDQMNSKSGNNIPNTKDIVYYLSHQK